VRADVPAPSPSPSSGQPDTFQARPDTFQGWGRGQGQGQGQPAPFMRVTSMQKEWADEPQASAMSDMYSISCLGQRRNTERISEIWSDQFGWILSSHPLWSCRPSSRRHVTCHPRTK
jgi:hypothetical protein